ncbi:MAG: hypothetical protein A2542_02650 [Parcubacteria group bacterium RIFOXYD2_FULL_52_8]|nr:MAG: hypothetical protein A2542_02650 [Parcubacteria group bacterium RIFOXYD2_FULL_52_8]
MSSKQALQVDEPLIKKQLRAVIGRKKKLLEQLVAQIETTRSELMAIKGEYDRRIGILYEKLEELDERFFELKRLCDLLQKKLPLAEAKRLLAERRQAQAERDEERAQGEEKQHAEFMERAKKLKPVEREELRKLWRRLAFRYHPDLVHDEEQKRYREIMMKRVNDAYARADLQALKAIACEEATTEENLADASMTDLEQSLMDTEAGIRRLRQKLKAFKKLEWYGWKQHIEEAKRENRDFFATLEKGTQKNIKEKEREIAKLEDVVASYK